MWILGRRRRDHEHVWTDGRVELLRLQAMEASADRVPFGSRRCRTCGTIEFRGLDERLAGYVTDDASAVDDGAVDDGAAHEASRPATVVSVEGGPAGELEDVVERVEADRVRAPGRR